MDGRWTIRLDHAGNELAAAQPELSDLLVPVVPCDDAAVERAARALWNEAEALEKTYAGQHARRYVVTSWADADDGEREDCRERVRLVFRAAGETP